MNRQSQEIIIGIFRIVVIVITVVAVLFLFVKFHLIEFVANLVPLLVAGGILVFCVYQSFISRDFEKLRYPMGSAFFIGVMAFGALVSLLGVDQIRFFSGFTYNPTVGMPGLLIGVINGLILMYIIKKWGKSQPRYIIMILSIFSFTLLYFYLFSSDVFSEYIDTISQFVPLFSIGMMMGILFRVDENFSQLMKPKKSN